MPLYEGIGMINEKHPVVLEIGQSLTKAGFAGENSPRCIIPSGLKSKDDPKTFKRLMDYKDETDLYQMLVEFLHHIYCRHLLVTPKDRKVVVVESLLGKTEWRHILAKVLYLHYEVLTILWIPNSLSAVCATGSDTALIVDIGLEEVQVTPVFNGVTILSCTMFHELGAKVFDQNLKSLLLENCLNKSKEELLPLLSDRVVEDIRVRCCVVTSTSRAEKFANNDTSFINSLKPLLFEVDGENFLEFNGAVREIAAEIWFQNDDLDGISIPSMIIESLSRCPLDSRRHLASSILITGGTGMLPGLKGRLVRELKKVSAAMKKEADERVDEAYLTQGSYDFRIYNAPTAENCINWLGGALYGASEAMSLRGVTKEFFLKNGLVPDWCNLQYDMVNGLSSSGISAYGSSPTLTKGL